MTNGNDILEHMEKNEERLTTDFKDKYADEWHSFVLEDHADCQFFEDDRINDERNEKKMEEEGLLNLQKKR